jgi:hypothetical protein
VTAGVSATCGSSDGAGSATGPGHSAPVLDLVYLSLQSYGACLLPACSLGRQARLGVPAVKSTLAAPLATTLFLLFLSALASLLPTRHGFKNRQEQGGKTIEEHYERDEPSNCEPCLRGLRARSSLQ